MTSREGRADGFVLSFASDDAVRLEELSESPWEDVGAAGNKNKLI